MLPLIKDLVGNPLEGITGLNELVAELCRSKSTGLYHTGTADGCDKDLYKGRDGYDKVYHIPLGEALSKLCPRCMESTSLRLYSDEYYGSGTYILVRDLLYIIKVNAVRFPDADAIKKMEAVEVYELLFRVLTPVTHADFARSKRSTVPWDRYFSHLQWFTQESEGTNAYIELLKKRMSEVDLAPLKLKLAREVLSPRLPPLKGRSAAVKAFKELAEAEAQLYVKDNSQHFVEFTRGRSGLVLLDVLDRLYGIENRSMMIVPSVVLDYIISEASWCVKQSCKLPSRPTPERIENALALYEPNEKKSTFSTFRAAYAAACKV